MAEAAVYAAGALALLFLTRPTPLTVTLAVVFGCWALFRGWVAARKN